LAISTSSALGSPGPAAAAAAVAAAACWPGMPSGRGRFCPTMMDVMPCCWPDKLPPAFSRAVAAAAAAAEISRVRASMSLRILPWQCSQHSRTTTAAEEDDQQDDQRLRNVRRNYIMIPLTQLQSAAN
jgi:hypothetical protein